jgi:dihydroorotate dehydrogenase (NAD+) catalytic subunit
LFQRGSPPPSLRTCLAALDLRSPVILASGILGYSFEIFERIIEAGAGAVVSKSIGVNPRVGYANPTVVEVDCGYLNAVGLAGPGYRAFCSEMTKYDAKELPIIVSLFGSTPQEFKTMAEEIEKHHAIAYELNLSCPHVGKVGTEVGEDDELVEKIIKSVKRTTTKPVFAKLSPMFMHIEEKAKVAVEAGADGITAINTIKAMGFDIDLGIPLLSNEVGGLSGKAIKSVGVRCVYEIAGAVDVPVIGCGGVETWEDAIEYFIAGASAVQVGTAISVHSIEIFRELNKGISDYLALKGIKDIAGLVGNYRRTRKDSGGKTIQ